MAKTKSVKIEWFGEDLKRAVEKGGEPALWRAGQTLAQEAAGRAPAQSGLLKASAYVITDKRQDYRKGRRDRRKLPFPRRDIVTVGFAAWYGNLLEDSGAKRHVMPRKGRRIMRIASGKIYSTTSHPGMRAKPFLGPAMDALQSRLGQMICDDLGDQIEKDMPRA